MSEELVRAQVKRMYDASDAVAELKKPTLKEQEMEAEVNRILHEQEQPRITRFRLRLDGHLMRLDETVAAEGVELTAEAPPTKTYVNAGNPSLGDFTHFDYDYQAEIATLYNDKSRWHARKMNDYYGVPEPVRLLFQAILGKPNSDRTALLPDDELIRNAWSGNWQGILLTTEAVEYDGKRLDSVSIRSKEEPDRLLMMFFCDPHDYSKVYRLETYNPQSGEPLYVQEAREFDAKGMPRVLSRWRYEANSGELLSHEEEFIEEYALDVSIPEDVFKFDPPKNLGIVDRRFDQPFAVSPDARAPNRAVDLRKKPKSATKPELLANELEAGGRQNTEMAPGESMDFGVGQKRVNNWYRYILVAVCVGTTTGIVLINKKRKSRQ